MLTPIRFRVAKLKNNSHFGKTILISNLHKLAGSLHLLELSGWTYTHQRDKKA